MSSIHPVATAAGAAVDPRATPVVVSTPRAMAWLMSATTLGMVVYYFFAADQGAVSVFGNAAMLHEFVHDGRHFLGFPCH